MRKPGDWELSVTRSFGSAGMETSAWTEKSWGAGGGVEESFNSHLSKQELKLAPECEPSLAQCVTGATGLGGNRRGSGGKQRRAGEVNTSGWRLRAIPPR